MQIRSSFYNPSAVFSVSDKKDQNQDNEDKSDESDSLDKIDIHTLAQKKRSKLNRSEYVSWLRSRFQSSAKKQYLYYPDELLKHIEIKNIFKSFDKDHSKSLDMVEIQKMFESNNMGIRMEDLRELFKIVDDDHDNKLNQKEFKKCTLNPKANEIFTKIMRRLRLEEGKKNENERLTYLPMTWGKMVSFLSYCISRGDIRKEIDDKPIHIKDKMEKYQELLGISNVYFPKKTFKIHRANSNPKLKMNQRRTIPPNVNSSTQETKNFVDSTEPEENSNHQDDEKVESSRKKRLKAFYDKEIKEIIQSARERAFGEAVEEMTLRPDNFLNLEKTEGAKKDKKRAMHLTNRSSKQGVTSQDRPRFLSRTSNNFFKTERSAVSSEQNKKNVLSSILHPLKPNPKEIISKIPIQKNLREIDNLISENLRNKQKNSGEIFSLESLESREYKMKQQLIKQYRNEIDELRKIASTQYGVELEKETEGNVEKRATSRGAMIDLDFEVFNSPKTLPSETKRTPPKFKEKVLTQKYRKSGMRNPNVPVDFMLQMGIAKEGLKDLPLTNFRYARQNYDYLELLNQKKPQPKTKVFNHTARLYTSNGAQIIDKEIFFKPTT